MGDVKLISAGLFGEVADLAAASPRRRMNHNFHQRADDNPHRFLNVLLRGTYIRPHRHVTPPKAETFLVLEGVAEAILFDDKGSITARYSLGRETPKGRVWGIDVPAGVWHTVLPRTERAVCFEVKPGRGYRPPIRNSRRGPRRKIRRPWPSIAGCCWKGRR